ncbi:MAG TPA: MarR family transcriptional regulator [Oxalicibacterium sp.]|uniref:MarR family winged helix-turn-helix transcriptional regulator n=1 Tax=Oxalicibacterium sp. TaxID=2766525 RepID=UPI002BADBF0E|nr:MarR family transcriptional regulator [Oxalicibacterium sp.]HWU98325.1 MarR family transcriptional regulator [Oxalicibacterium sp.]
MFEHCLYFNTTALARTLEREWTKAFKPFGLTPSQAFMLRVVLAKPGLLQSELAAELSISRSTATRTLDGLQQLKLLERRATDRDGRESAIEPTELAESMKDGINAASAEVTRRLKKELSVAKFDETVANVRAVRVGLE